MQNERSDLFCSQLKLLCLQEIAELKMPDLNCTNVEAAMRIVEGTAKNMGVKIEAVAA